VTGFIILVLIFLLAIWIYTVLAKLPGQKARQRGHPQAEAISVLSWVGLLFGGVPWLIALVWAHTTPVGGPVPVAPQPSAEVEPEAEGATP
jgi:hypothetical protein